MQVFGLPGHVTRNGRRASRLLDAETANIEAERRRDAVARWRGARRAGLTAEQAAQAVGVPRATLYRWQKAPVPKSRRPHRMRQKNWSPALRTEVERLRLDFPMWGKEKLGPILRDQGFTVSNATVGRIIDSLIARGRVPRVADLIRKATRKAQPRKRPHAVRKPSHVSFEKPGDVIQIDTLSVAISPNLAVKHFDAYDVHAKWTVAKPYRNATASNAADFLDKVTAEMPWPVKRHSDRRRLRVHGRVRGRLRRKGHPPLCPAAALAKAQRRRRTMQRRLAIRILRRRRPAQRPRQDRRSRRCLPAPLQPLQAARGSRRKDPKPVSPSLPSKR
jgi:putative transposase